MSQQHSAAPAMTPTVAKARRLVAVIYQVYPRSFRDSRRRRHG
ncbi:alpha-glucosidase [Streptomyces purpurascens]